MALEAISPKNKTSAKDEGNAMSLMIQRFLDKHGLGDTGVSPTPEGSGPGSQRSPSPKKVSKSSSDKNEEFYLNNCPVELASICVKLLVDVMVQVGKCQSMADVPP